MSDQRKGNKKNNNRKNDQFNQVSPTRENERAVLEESKQEPSGWDFDPFKPQPAAKPKAGQ